MPKYQYLEELNNAFTFIQLDYDVRILGCESYLLPDDDMLYITICYDEVMLKNPDRDDWWYHSAVDFPLFVVPFADVVLYEYIRGK